MSAHKIKVSKRVYQNEKSVEHTAEIEFVLHDGYQPKTAEKHQEDALEIESKTDALFRSLKAAS